MDNKTDTGNGLGDMDNDMDFEAMLDGATAPARKVSIGDKVDAYIIKIGGDYAFLDLGSRTEGILSIEELKDQEGEMGFKEGDTITVFVTAFRDGGVLCARRLGGTSGGDRQDDKESQIAALKDAFDAGMPVECVVNESVKGGFSLSVMGMRAFCPISQIDNKYCENPDEFLGQTLQFEIVKFEEGGRNIVVSRRKILEAEAEEKAGELWKKISVGQTFEGVVSSIREYGAFVDIGGTDGLLHISEISYDRIEDPKDVLEVGQKVTVAVKELDPVKRKISLSLKALMEDPWVEAPSKLKSNQVYKGRVVRIARFGVFVELMPGIEGLVHISEMAADRHINNPRELVSDGQEIEVRILEIDLEQKRISLTMNTDDSERRWKENLKSPTNGSSMGTLGDLLKNKL